MESPTHPPNLRSPLEDHGDEAKRALISGVTRQDGAYLARCAPGRGLRGPRHRAAVEFTSTCSTSPALAWHRAPGQAPRRPPCQPKLCLEQILPRRRGQRIELRGFLAEADQDLAKAQLLITNQMLSGELSPEEALALSEVVARMDAADDVELRRRRTELQRKIGTEIIVALVESDGWVRSVIEWVDDDVS